MTNGATMHSDQASVQVTAQLDIMDIMGAWKAPGVQWVYFAERDGLVKIGYSADVERRMRQLGARLLLVLPGGESIESWMHRQFAAYNAHGEWFHPGLELVALIEGLTGRDSGLPEDYRWEELDRRHAAQRAANRAVPWMPPLVFDPEDDRRAADTRGAQLDSGEDQLNRFLAEGPARVAS